MNEPEEEGGDDDGIRGGGSVALCGISTGAALGGLLLLPSWPYQSASQMKLKKETRKITSPKFLST